MAAVAGSSSSINGHNSKGPKTSPHDVDLAFQQPSNPDGPTGQLVNWICSLKLSDIPSHIIERTKHLALDGLACGLVGAHVPWSEAAFDATQLFEPGTGGTHTLIGYDQKVSVLTAALLNGTFIQATELDDYHSLAPWHSMSILLPALLAASQSSTEPVSGTDFLLALIVGLEVGPRVGHALDGGYLLTSGWHSGPVFGHPAAAAAVSKLWGLSPLQTEEAMGIASTQACGLMSAQYGGMVKRMQHAFAARNGLFAAFMAKGKYRGIQQVFERPYGGLLAMFSKGNTNDPAYSPEKIHEELGQKWQLETVRIKMYACVGAVHGMIEALADLQAENPERFADLDSIKNITVGLSSPAFHHDGWSPGERPLSTTGAQMCGPYIAATQLVDGQVLLAQFGASQLDRDDVWSLTRRISCYHDEEFDSVKEWGVGARIRVEFTDGEILNKVRRQPRGFQPGTTNEEIVDKYRKLTKGLVTPERATRIENMVRELDRVEDIREIFALLQGNVANPLA